MKADWLQLAYKLNLSLSQLIRHAVKEFHDNLSSAYKLSEESSFSDDSNSREVSDIDKESMKKRMKGLIKIHKKLPIQKVALGLNTSEEKAETLIYELASEEGIVGEMKDEIFEYKCDPSIVIDKISELIDKL